ncbi:ATP--cob(I)alamin adenosyltransferase [Synergistales bacterium]|nr:ATP--cob(I)alamin adenosyltransferase [Synergistales bacterium]
MLKIYTKTGDSGNTRLWDGTLVRKDNPCIETNGALDELNSAIGIARSIAPQSMKEELNRLQNNLTNLMAYIARGQKQYPAPPAAELEEWIDLIMAEFPPGNSFVNPGESQTGAVLHLARTIARRAERAALPLIENGDAEPSAYQYINRLSDLLFALAHKADAAATRDTLVKTP